MLFDCIVLLLIILITLYLANQGMVSAILALITATFASILAMGLMESLQGIIAGYKPEYARGATFLLLFFLGFSACRIIADIAVPKNIKLSLWVNRGVAGLVGFFTALVVMGTTIIGLEMLPLPRSILMYDRFPTDQAMQGSTPGTLAQPEGVWLNPDRFVLAIWDGVSGRSLSGDHAWGIIHPDMSVESYGYRNPPQFGSHRTLSQDLLTVDGCWSPDAKDAQAFGLGEPESGKKYVVVRAVIGQAGDAAKSSEDEGDDSSLHIDAPYFRVSASQVRLTTNTAQQHYPIGYLGWLPRSEQDRQRVYHFGPLSLDTGYVVDGYNTQKKVIEDWVFIVDDNETPQNLEIKELARQPVGPIDTKGLASAKGGPSAYPRKLYLDETVEFTATVQNLKGPVVSGAVYLLKPGIAQKDIAAICDIGYQKAVQIGENTLNWPDEENSARPSKFAFKAVLFTGQAISTTPDRTFSWGEALRLILLGWADPDPSRNMVNYPKNWKEILVPFWQNKMSAGSAIIESADLGASGKVTISRIPPGQHAIVVIVKSEHGFYVWEDDVKFTAAQKKQSNTYDGNNPYFKLEEQ